MGYLDKLIDLVIAWTGMYFWDLFCSCFYFFLCLFSLLNSYSCKQRINCKWNWKKKKTADPDVIIKYHVWMKLNREEEEADGYPDVLVEASREVAVTILALLLHLRASIQLFLSFLIFFRKNSSSSLGTTVQHIFLANFKTEQFFPVPLWRSL